MSTATTTLAARRLAGHEPCQALLTRCAVDLAHQMGLPLSALVYRADWSHEYPETGVILEVTIRGATRERMAYWDALSEQMDRAIAQLSAAERAWYEASVSVSVEAVAEGQPEKAQRSQILAMVRETGAQP